MNLTRYLILNSHSEDVPVTVMAESEREAIEFAIRGEGEVGQKFAHEAEIVGCRCLSDDC